MTHYNVVYDVEIVIDQPSCTMEGSASSRRAEDLG